MKAKQSKNKKKQKWLRVKSFFLKCEEGTAGMEILISCLRSLILCVCVWWERRTMISNAYRKSEPLFSASQTHQWGENQKSRTRQLRRSVVVSGIDSCDISLWIYNLRRPPSLSLSLMYRYSRIRVYSFKQSLEMQFPFLPYQTKKFYRNKKKEEGREVFGERTENPAVFQ